MNNIKELRTQVFNKFELPENNHNLDALKDKLLLKGYRFRKTTDLRKKETWLKLLNDDLSDIITQLPSQETLEKLDNKLQELEQKEAILLQENKKIIEKAKSRLAPAQRKALEEKERLDKETAEQKEEYLNSLRGEGEEILKDIHETLEKAKQIIDDSEIDAEINFNEDAHTAIILEFPSQSPSLKKNARISKTRSKNAE